MTVKIDIYYIINTHEENVKWATSEEHKKWVELAHNRPIDKDIGYWSYDTVEKKWKFEEPKRF